MLPRPVPTRAASARTSNAGLPWLPAIAGCLLACASIQTAHFSGAAATAAISADDLQQHDYVPHDHLAIGTVTTDCTASSHDDPDEHCSELELMRVLREAAASHGGTAFVAPSCGYASRSPSRQSMRCTATVARRRSMLPPNATAIHSSAAQERQWEVQIEGQRVRITVQPAPGTTPSPIDVASVEIAWTLDDSAKLFGTVQAECEGRCQRALVERGLLEGTAWLGAREIGRVRCHEVQASRWSCTGDAVSSP